VGIWKRDTGKPPAPPPARPVAETVASQAEFLAAPPVLRALLGKESEVNGKLSFSGPTRIDGRLRGEVRASDVLVIGESGYVHGIVRAGNLIILGRLEGQIVGADRVEIGPRGTFSGSVETRALVVREGGLLDGDCRVAARATVHVLRPRAEGDTQ
jgi:cytoskeletal protein CcmA (bactofilin family)